MGLKEVKRVGCLELGFKVGRDDDLAGRADGFRDDFAAGFPVTNEVGFLVNSVVAATS